MAYKDKAVQNQYHREWAQKNRDKVASSQMRYWAKKNAEIDEARGESPQGQEDAANGI